jgi:hypothetical protein
MRAGRRALAALALAVAAGAGASAHRRDEHLQAALITISPDHVLVDLDITPGADLAEGAIAAIDADGDGAVSEAERAAYANAVAGALRLANDREAHALSVVAAEFPDLSAIRRGEGTIALRLRAALRPGLAAGAHELIFGNGHQPAQSVYLANARVPESRHVTIVSQRRTATQHELTIAYTLAPKASPAVLAALLATAIGVLGALAIARRLRPPPDPVV